MVAASVVRSRARVLLGLLCVLLLAVPLGGVGSPGAAEHVRISATEDACRLVAAPTAFPVGVAGGCSGVRPGAVFNSPTGGCTFNFVFRGSDGYDYVGTAGHCLLASSGETKWGLGGGPSIRDSGGRTVGHGAYAVLKGNRDFALVRLNRDVKANPQMCHFGGPTGVDTSRQTEPVFLEHYGGGIGVSSLTPGRTSLALNMRDPDTISAFGAAAFGDSGSGALRNGQAVGVLVAIGVDLGSPGVIFMTRLGPQLEMARRSLGIDLTLRTASRL